MDEDSSLRMPSPPDRENHTRSPSHRETLSGLYQKAAINSPVAADIHIEVDVQAVMNHRVFPNRAKARMCSSGAISFLPKPLKIDFSRPPVRLPAKIQK